MPLGPRQFIENRIGELAGELEVLFESAREHARREQSEQLNQAVRRLRIAPDPEELCATLADAASHLATGALLFRIAGGLATSDRMTIPLSDAPALSAAAGSTDPLIVAASAAEISEPLLDFLGEDPGARVTFFPVSCRDTISAVLFCWGPVQLAALELLTQVAGATWGNMHAPPELVAIAPAAAPAEPEAPEEPARPSIAWEDLPPEDQSMHLRAQRFARVQAAELRLYHSDVVQIGRTRRNLYEALRQPIDDVRRSFRTRFFDPCPSMVDYLHLELIRTLANDDPDLFGTSYPGPLV
jgi:hypothetical protein